MYAPVRSTHGLSCSQATACLPSGRNSTYHPVQISAAGSSPSRTRITWAANHCLPVAVAMSRRFSSAAAGRADNPDSSTRSPMFGRAPSTADVSAPLRKQCGSSANPGVWRATGAQSRLPPRGGKVHSIVGPCCGLSRQGGTPKSRAFGIPKVVRSYRCLNVDLLGGLPLSGGAFGEMPTYRSYWPSRRWHLAASMPGGG
jgi:hypothetical protein